MRPPNIASAMLVSLLALSSEIRAEVSLASLFVDHAVVQRNKPIPIWGKGSPGEHLAITFGQYSAAAEPDANGRWLAYLEPQAASLEGKDLVIAGENTVVVHDVMVGEVWLCSGQSNMEFIMNAGVGSTYRVNNADEEVAAAHYPLIRQFKVNHAVADAPAESVKGKWEICSPETAAQFTAVGFFFAREIYRKLGVPVGLINSTWGGTPVESWMDTSSLAGDPAFAVVHQRWRQTLEDYPKLKTAYDLAVANWVRDEAVAKTAGERRHTDWVAANPYPRAAQGPGGSATPAGLFNGMINPLVPFALRGILWYQGEGNTGRPREYHPLFAAMIAGWRARFGQGDVPFFWVQLANFRIGPEDNDNWAVLREAQAKTLSLTNTGMAVTIDIGDDNDVHPRNKQEVGRRLALIAGAQVYDHDAVSGPVFSGCHREGTSLRVYFSGAVTGLVSRGGPPQFFEVAGPDKKFHPATAVIQGETLLVHADAVAEPVAVRYAWRNAPLANLSNGAGLPARPFRSQDK